MFRRYTAFLLMLCLAVFSGEALLADVHLGDATSEELPLAGSAHDLSRTLTTERDADGTTSLPPQEQSPSDDSPGQPTHAQHACHCVHAHGGPDGACELMGMEPTHPTAALAHADGVPPSVEREPQLRPPIA